MILKSHVIIHCILYVCLKTQRTNYRKQTVYWTILFYIYYSTEDIFKNT
jgi:hypothetical protein